MNRAYFFHLNLLNDNLKFLRGMRPHFERKNKFSTFGLPKSKPSLHDSLIEHGIDFREEIVNLFLLSLNLSIKVFYRSLFEVQVEIS